MRLIIPILSILLALPASGAVYKWVDEKGDVHYSDVPQKGAEEVQLRETTIYSPTPVRGVTQPPAVETPAPKVEVEEAAAAYNEVVIANPHMNKTVRSNSGDLNIALEIQPPLKEGHIIRLYLDGEELPNRFEAPRMVITVLERGPHTLQAYVTDSEDKKLTSSQPIIFFLRRESVFSHPAPPDQEPEPPTGPVYGQPLVPMMPQAPRKDPAKGRRRPPPPTDYQPRYEPQPQGQINTSPSE